MTSVVPISRHLGLSQEGIDCGYPLARWCLIAPFFAKVDPLLVSHQADVATLLAVTKSGYGQKPKGTKKQAHTKPNTAMAFVLGDGSAKDGARYPEEKNREQEAHHQSVIATQR